MKIAPAPAGKTGEGLQQHPARCREPWAPHRPRHIPGWRTSSGWGVSKLLTSLYSLFEVCPAHREDFMTAIGTSIFPLKFCSHWWMENDPVATHALEIWSHVKLHVSRVNEKGVRHPSNASFDTGVLC